jgi:hypothetical protein
MKRLAIYGFVVAAAACLLFGLQRLRTPESEIAVGSSAPSLAKPSQPIPSRPVLNGKSKSRFETAPDLYALLQQLNDEASAGNVDAGWLAMKIRLYCGEFAKDPPSYMEATKGMMAIVPKPRAQVYQQARSRIANKCSRFEKDDALSRHQVDELTAKLAAAGSVAAQASELASHPDKFSPEQANDLVKTIKLGGDSESLLALGDAVVTSAPAREAAFGSQATVEEAQIALQLVACSRGLDCSPSGALMTMYCANGGVCGSFFNFRDLVRRGLLTEAGSQQVDTLAQTFH